MGATTTFEFDCGKLDDLKTALKTKFNVVSEFVNPQQKIVAQLKLSNKSESIHVIFYGTGKGVIQGKAGQFYDAVSALLTASGQCAVLQSPVAQAPRVDEAKLYETADFIVGFDEAGKGETIGSLILAGVVVPKDKCALFKGLKKDIKSLSLKELNYWCTVMDKQGIRKEYVVVSAAELSHASVSLNRILDQKYLELVRRYANVLNGKYLLAFDDYGIMDELNDHLASLSTNNGVRHIAHSHLDEEITAAKLASVVARQIRLSSMENLERQNRIEHQGKTVSFGKGASGQETDDWLRAHRAVHPHMDFPDIVRKSWKNVKNIELEHPKKNVELSIVCPACTAPVSKILMYHNAAQSTMLYYCSACSKQIANDFLKSQKFTHLLMDTSAKVGGMISKDLNSSTPIFRGRSVVLLHKILDEIETLPLSLKNGALNELQRLREHAQKANISIVTKDFEITDPYDADKKLYDTIARNNGFVLVSGDKTLADTAHAQGAFVFKVIGYPPHQTTLSQVNVKPA